MSRLFDTPSSAVAAERRKDLLEEARMARLARDATTATAAADTRGTARAGGLLRRARGAPA